MLRRHAYSLTNQFQCKPCNKPIHLSGMITDINRTKSPINSPISGINPLFP